MTTTTNNQEVPVFKVKTKISIASFSGVATFKCQFEDAEFHKAFVKKCFNLGMSDLAYTDKKSSEHKLKEWLSLDEIKQGIVLQAQGKRIKLMLARPAMPVIPEHCIVNDVITTSNEASLF